ncbi:MAG: peroxiredoxin [Pseudomonadota bacterium]
MNDKNMLGLNRWTLTARLLVAPLFAAVLLATAAVAQTVNEGGQAPAFRLQDQNGNWHTLDDYRGRWVALYFYPRADSPSCTAQACAFRDDIFKFKSLNVAVVGVSLDAVAVQQAFAEKNSLPFPLLSDVGSATARVYGVLNEYGPIRMAVRETFIIAPDGTIARHYDRVDPEAHSQQVLTDLRRLLHRAQNGG